MKLAIMQPYFLPYLGYYQMMAAVDKFVVLDDANYMKGGWLNRNRIQSFGKVQWLTIPVAGASPHKLICEVDHQINEKFIKKTSKSIEGAYRSAANYCEGKTLFDEIIGSPKINFADFLLDSLLSIQRYLDLRCEIVPTSRVYQNTELSGQERVLDICDRESADVYINLPGGKSIYDSGSFAERGIELKFIEPQLPEYGPEFEPGLSILDVIMKNSKDESRRMAASVVLS